MAKIFGQLEKAQLENTTSDTASHPKGMITYRTDLNQPKVSNGTVYKLLIDEDSTQTLSNKTLVSPSVTGAITGSQIATPSNPSAGNNKFYFKSDNKLYTLDSAGNEAQVGSGGGSGVRNLITNGTAEDTATSIFVPYADAAGTRPVDGTGGSPTVTTAISSSSPLDGTKVFTLTKPASNVQGQGWAVPFSVPLAFRAKALSISVQYLVESGTFVAGTNTTDGDVIWYVYDITNSKLVEPSNIKMLSNSSTISAVFQAQFQLDSNCTDARLIAHVASTSASAFVLKVDNVTVSPSQNIFGSPVTDWQDRGTITITGSTSNPTKGTTSLDKMWTRRVGDNLEVRVEYVQSGTGTAGSGDYLLTLPAGLSIDTAKVTADSGIEGGGSAFTLNNVVGTASMGGPTDNAVCNVFVHDSTRLRIGMISSGATGSLNSVGVWGSTYYPLSGTDFYVAAEFSVPISGWSSSVQTSDQVAWVDDVGEICSFGVPATSTPENFLYCDGSSVSRAVYADLFRKIGTAFGSVDGSSFNLPDLRGRFLRGVDGSAGRDPNDSTRTAMNTGGNTGDNVGSVQTDAMQGHIHQFTTFFNAGYSPAGASQGTGGSSGPGNTAGPITDGVNGTPRTSSETRPINAYVNYFIRFRRSAAPIISATETVVMRATKNSGSNTTSGSFQAVASWQAISNPTSFDSHNAFNTTTGVFTCPTAGRYHVSGTITLGVNGTGTFRASYVLKNSGIYALGNLVPPNAVIRVGLPFSTIVQCNAGDTISIATNQDSGGSIGYSTAPEDNQLNIQRIGL
jgi:microcystin-dependent protein